MLQLKAMTSSNQPSTHASPSPKIAFVFPGQGSQSVGMGFNLLDRYPDFETLLLETLREADGVLGFSLSRLLQEGPAADLQLTENTQPALLAVSTALGRYLKRHGKTCDLVLGHSLGEYSALVFAESIAFAEAIRLVRLRGQWMSEAVAPGTAGMAALVGATEESAQNLCKAISATGGILEISLRNAPQQIVVSGTKDALMQAQIIARDLGIRKVVLLDVSGPFHSSLLKSAADKMRRELQTTPIQTPRIPVVINVSAASVSEPDLIRAALAIQVSQTVLWEASVRQAWNMGARVFVEVGASQVLTGLIQKILPEAKALSLETLKAESLIEDLW